MEKRARQTLGPAALVVTANAELADALRRPLETWGYRVEIAALARGVIARCVSHRPLVVIADVALADGDGIDCAFRST